MRGDAETKSCLSSRRSSIPWTCSPVPHSNLPTAPSGSPCALVSAASRLGVLSEDGWVDLIKTVKLPKLFSLLQLNADVFPPAQYDLGQNWTALSLRFPQVKWNPPYKSLAQNKHLVIDDKDGEDNPVSEEYFPFSLVYNTFFPSPTACFLWCHDITIPILFKYFIYLFYLF